MRISDWSSDVCSSDLDLGAALLAHHAAVLHALVLAAQALVVLDRPEDGGAEQAVALGLEGAVVDRLGLLDFAERPRADQVRRGQRDLDRVEVERRALLVEHVQKVFHRSEEHTSELQSLMSISYAVLCLKQKKSNA